ncbi:unnamed protein product [Phytophthora fragariaefolia]|uniref:Unnamed protein product n=1 Tax=Phytophthora fragariaefolia TaxID=1490495 RepID=A0A9W6U9H9_9STRA|nr:unnamed protein product [Phytophthora fragariaefolia]
MRCTLFFALLVATFVACISVTNAEAVALLKEGRNLRAQQVIAYKADDIAAKFIETMKEKSILSKAAKMAAGAKEASKLNKEQTAKLTKMVADAAQKDPKKWSKMKKIIVGTLGVTIGGTIIYQVGKHLAKTAAPAATTNGSA